MTDQNLKDLEDKIAQMKTTKAGKSDREEDGRQMSVGMQAGSEFVAYVLSGGLAGFLLDRFFDTLPLMLIILLFTGFGYGIYRAARLMK